MRLPVRPLRIAFPNVCLKREASMKRAFLKCIITGSLVVTALAGPASAGDVTLAWDPNAEPDIAGYVVWYGTLPGTYTANIDVGNRTLWTLSGLVEGQRYYFTVQAYNTSRAMSPLSTEVSTDLPSTVAGSDPQSGSGSTAACKTLKPGANWTCDAATGNWLPPGYRAPSSSTNTGSTGRTSSGTTVACTSIRPAANWTCDSSTGNWLPPGYGGTDSGSSSQSRATDGTQGDLLYLFQSVAGSALTGWVVLLPDQSGSSGFDAYRNNTKIGQWSTGTGAAQLTLAGGVVDVNVPAATDLVAWQPATGLWFMLKTVDGTLFTSQASAQWGYGAARDIPAPGDYDGDGKIDLAVWRPSIATWYVLKSSEGYDTQRSLVVQWGDAGDMAAQGDYDGDGKTDLAVWRPSASMTVVLKSSQGYSAQQCLAIQYGSTAAASPCTATVRATGSSGS
jgi:hypothetical protein